MYDFVVLLDLMSQPKEYGSEELANQYTSKTGQRISPRTVRKLRAKYFFLRAKKPKPFLTEEQMKARKKHCQRAKDGTLLNPDTCMFVDECVFKVKADTGRVYVADPNDPALWTEKRQKEPTAQFFGGICGFGTPPLVEISGTMDSNGYQRLLRDHYKGFVEGAGLDARVDWIQDNATVHGTSANLAMMFFWRWHVIPHPAKSPDLNPVEFAWLVMQELLKHYKPRTKAQLVQAIKELWPLAANPQQFEHYMHSFWGNVENTLELNGGNRYKENRFLRSTRY